MARSTKNFLLQLHSSSSSKQYVLVLSEHLSTSDFISDIHELFPPPTDANPPPPVLKLNGEYPMTPRQFLRYMSTVVPYSPPISGGICAPKLFGASNAVEIVYGSGTGPEVKKEAINVNVVTAAVNNLTISATSQKSADDKRNADIDTTQSSKPPAMVSDSRQPQRKPSQSSQPKAMENTDLNEMPTLDNRPRRLTIRPEIHVTDTKLELWLSPITIENAVKIGGPKEVSTIEQTIIKNLPKWVDSSDIKISMAFSFSFSTISSSDFRWDESSFRYYSSGQSGYWQISIIAIVTIPTKKKV